MAASGTTILRGKTLLAPSQTTGKDFETLPLPWPRPGMSIREARRPHGHQCVICSEHFRCSGPDSTGECAPLCGPCLWVELGAQLRIYQSMADEIDRRRRKLEQKVGAAKCRKAQTRKLSRLRTSKLVAGFGRMVLTGEQSSSAVARDNRRLELLRSDSSSDDFETSVTPRLLTGGRP
jgi:hypothetical protein